MLPGADEARRELQEHLPEFGDLPRGTHFMTIGRSVGRFTRYRLTAWLFIWPLHADPPDCLPLRQLHGAGGGDRSCILLDRNLFDLNTGWLQYVGGIIRVDDEVGDRPQTAQDVVDALASSYSEMLPKYMDALPGLMVEVLKDDRRRSLDGELDRQNQVAKENLKLLLGGLVARPDTFDASYTGASRPVVAAVGRHISGKALKAMALRDIRVVERMAQAMEPEKPGALTRAWDSAYGSGQRYYLNSDYLRPLGGELLVANADSFFRPALSGVLDQQEGDRMIHMVNRTQELFGHTSLAKCLGILCGGWAAADGLILVVRLMPFPVAWMELSDEHQITAGSSHHGVIKRIAINTGTHQGADIVKKIDQITEGCSTEGDKEREKLSELIDDVEWQKLFSS